MSSAALQAKLGLSGGAISGFLDWFLPRKGPSSLGPLLSLSKT
jgi:hypothetical protein